MLKRTGEERAVLYGAIGKQEEMRWIGGNLGRRNWKGEGQKPEEISRSNVTRQKMSRILHEIRSGFTC
jgi:hypothetical protein